MTVTYDFHLKFDDLRKSSERLKMLLSKYRSAKIISPEAAIQVITDKELYIAPYNWFEDRRATEEEVIEDALDDFIQRLRDRKKIILERLVKLDKKNIEVFFENNKTSFWPKEKIIALFQKVELKTIYNQSCLFKIVGIKSFLS